LTATATDCLQPVTAATRRIAWTMIVAVAVADNDHVNVNVNVNVNVG
jgi:hypothetical protein